MAASQFASWKKMKPKSTSKYRSQPVTIDDIRFHSKAEAEYYKKLKLLKQYNEISYFLMQVPFRLPAGIKYLVDFQIFYVDGLIRYVDIKGVMTPLSALKIKQVESIYPVKIEILSK